LLLTVDGLTAAPVLGRCPCTGEIGIRGEKATEGKSDSGRRVPRNAKSRPDEVQPASFLRRLSDVRYYGQDTTTEKMVVIQSVKSPPPTPASLSLSSWRIVSRDN